MTPDPDRAKSTVADLHPWQQPASDTSGHGSLTAFSRLAAPARRPVNGHPRSSGCSACSHRRWPAEPVAHPAARRGERDPQRIADDHQEQGGWRWQAHRHGASRPVTVTGNGRRPGSGAEANSPHHVPVHWLPGYQDHRGQDDCQRPHGKGDSRLSDRPCVLHPASIRPRRRPARKTVNILLARSAGTRINIRRA